MDSVQVAGSCPPVDGVAGTDGAIQTRVEVVECLALLVPGGAWGALRECKVTAPDRDSEPLIIGAKMRVGFLNLRGCWAGEAPFGRCLSLGGSLRVGCSGQRLGILRVVHPGHPEAGVGLASRCCGSSGLGGGLIKRLRNGRLAVGSELEFFRQGLLGIYGGRN